MTNQILNKCKESSHNCDAYMDFVIALHNSINLAIRHGAISVQDVNSCIQRAQYRAILTNYNGHELALHSFKRISA